MKRLKKLLIIFILIISFMYIGKVEVEAKEEKKKKNTSIETFDWDKANLECTYSDGRKYSYQGSFNDLDQTKPYSNNKVVERGEDSKALDFELVFKRITEGDFPFYDSLYYEDISLGKTIPEQNRIRGEAIFSKPSFLARGKYGILYCAPHAKKVSIDGRLDANDQNEGSKNTITYLTFNSNFGYNECIKMGGSSVWNSFIHPFKTNDMKNTCATGIKNSSLLSVEYTMNETTETKTYFLERNMSLKNSKNEQYGTDAVTSKEQIYVYVYSNLILVERNNHYIPLVEGADIFKNAILDSKIAKDKSATVYLNDPFFKKVGDYFEPSDDKHYKASTTKKAGYIEYKVSDVAQKETDNKDANRSICDYIPETSKLIRKVIKTLQILLPVILIISIVIDVLNIVKSDNQEKDIPALTKKIRTRLILAVVFFILPVFVGLIIRMLNQYTTIKNIAQIRCLFE